MSGVLTKQEFAFLKECLKALEDNGQRRLMGEGVRKNNIIEFWSYDRAAVVQKMEMLQQLREKIDTIPVL